MVLSDQALLHRPEPLPSLIYHALVLAVCFYTQNWALTLGPIWFLLMMFTIWTGLGQLAYFTLYTGIAIASRIEPMQYSSVIANGRRLLSLMLSSMMMSTTGTSLIFWVIFLYDPKLMIPPEFKYDPVLNHLQHTMPFVFALIEFFTFPHIRMSFKADFAATCLLPFTYMAMLFVMIYSGFLPYVFMQQFKIWHLIGFVSFCTMLLWLVYGRYAAIRRWRWNPRVLKSA